MAWIELLDPTPEELKEQAPCLLHDSTFQLLRTAPRHGGEPRPAFFAHGEYVFGVFVVAVVNREQNVVYYQELDMVLTHDTVLTVCKSPPDGRPPFDLARVREAVKPNDPPGIIAYHIVDEIAECYLDLVDDLDAEIDELEDNVETQPAELTRQRISELRHDLLRIRRVLGPTRDAVHRVVSGAVE